MNEEIKEAYDNDVYIWAFSDDNGWIDEDDLSHKLPLMPFDKYSVDFYVRKKTTLWRHKSLKHLGTPVRFDFTKLPNNWDEYLKEHW